MRTGIEQRVMKVVVVLLALLVLGYAANASAVTLPAGQTAIVATPIAKQTCVPVSQYQETVLPDEATPMSVIQALENQIAAIYETASPSVVNITNRSYVYLRFRGTVPQEGTGSGFVYDSDGHIVTNFHVVEGAEELVVTLATGEEFEAEIVGTDPANDLAVVRIDAAEALPDPLELADSGELRVGQFVVAIGTPFGLAQTLTTGVVSALERVIESPQDARFIGGAIQTDAAINPGNSGGPLLDMNAHVMGINSQIISPSGASSGVGFAVPSSAIQRVVPKLITQGYYPHPWLGVEMVSLNSATAALFREAGMDVPVDRGVLVVNVVAQGASAEAGLRGSSQTVQVGNNRIPVGGDIIVAVNDEDIESYSDLVVYLETRTSIRDIVELTIIREGQEQTIEVTLQEGPRD